MKFEEEDNLIFFSDNYKRFIKKILFSEEKIKTRVKKLAEEINSFYLEQYPNCFFPIFIIGILNSCIYFLTELARYFKFPFVIDFLKIKSYHGALTKQTPSSISFDLTTNFTNKNVLIIDDIIESGETMLKIKQWFEKQNVSSFKTAVLIKKTISESKSDSFSNLVNWYGFEIFQNDFLFGFGSDIYEQYRFLPFIAILDKKKLEQMFFKNKRNSI